MSLISFPPEPTGSDAAARFMRWVWQTLRELSRTQDVRGTSSGRTTRGTYIVPKATAAPGAPSPIPLINQWNAANDYVQRDLAFCFTNAEMDSGSQAGLYQCILSIAAAISGPANSEPAIDATHWKCVALLHYQKFTMISGDQKIVINVGRNDGSGAPKPSLKFYTDKDDEAAGSVQVDLTDIPSDAGNKILKIRTMAGKDTETGACYECLTLRSDWYTPP